MKYAEGNNCVKEQKAMLKDVHSVTDMKLSIISGCEMLLVPCVAEHTVSSVFIALFKCTVVDQYS